MRIKIRTSKAAIWARRLGSIAVPLLVLPVLMHRERYIDSGLFLVLIVFAAAVAALAVLLALLALVRLWFSGDQGWGRAIGGLVLGLFCLAPFGWYGALALRYPAITDIATAPRSELPLLFEPDTAAMAAPRVATAAEQQNVFPNAETRTYPLDVVQLFGLVNRLAEANDWDMRLRSEPADVTAEGRINARIVTWTGWPEEVVLRVRPAGAGGQVDMRSASIGAPLDFGSNGTRISGFLVALDAEVTAFMRDNPTITAAPADDDAVPDVETGNGD
ncbi:DUF1499 domain-containing protein [Devosia chinhatensis]|uniref:DUF1499 domain-containing protein n=1 Tax=Devosia chinhatensis TaxID=429727 RepID=A0A0F5FIS2_9HYPH|nr:DUF1499 domain-containing protein [Devosia chinhatensis]KKB08688.1 hypothetical protein VE26_00945 [Devosia chinhatensis]